MLIIAGRSGPLGVAVENWRAMCQNGLNSNDDSRGGSNNAFETKLHGMQKSRGMNHVVGKGSGHDIKSRQKYS